MQGFFSQWPGQHRLPNHPGEIEPMMINGSVIFARYFEDRRVSLDARCPHGHPPLSLEAAFAAASFFAITAPAGAV
jgi:hypothetical protein